MHLWAQIVGKIKLASTTPRTRASVSDAAASLRAVSAAGWSVTDRV